MSQYGAVAARIAGHAPLAVRAAKAVAQSALDETLEHALRFGGALRWILGQTEDAREGHAPSPSADPRATKDAERELGSISWWAVGLWFLGLFGSPPSA